MKLFLLALILITLKTGAFGCGSTEAAREAATQTEISTLITGLDLFQGDFGRFPTTQEGLRILVARPASIPSGAWNGPFVRQAEVPRDPWRREYVYRCPGVHNTNSYDLYSLGADGRSKSGGEDYDDISNWPHERGPGPVFDAMHGPARAVLTLIGGGALFAFVASGTAAKIGMVWKARWTRLLIEVGILLLFLFAFVFVHA